MLGREWGEGGGEDVRGGWGLALVRREGVGEGKEGRRGRASSSSFGRREEGDAF